MAYSLVYLISVLFVFPFSSLAQTNGTIAVGSSLTANNNATSWLSPSGDFAFGFQKIQSNGLFILSIWYDKIPDKTIVWFPNEAAEVPRGSRVELTADRGLILTDPRGTELWRTSDLNGNRVSYGVMNDTGNFELVQSDSSRIWSTFQHPSDTMLPTQVMGRGGFLYSRMSQTNFSIGRFILIFQQNGDLVLFPQNVASKFQYNAYYTSDTYNNTNSSNAGYQLIFNETGHMHILRGNGQIVDLTDQKVIGAADYYSRATLNFDGVFTLYYHPKNFTGNPGWTAVWWQPTNICLQDTGDQGKSGSGVCGFNSICKLQDHGRTSCECPQGYFFVDPNDAYGGCKPNYTQICDEDVPTNSVESLYDFEELIGTDWITPMYERLDPVSEEECKSSCASDCFCAAASYLGTGCWKKTLPLSNGIKDPQIAVRVFLKFRKGDLPHQNPNVPLAPRKKDRSSLVLVGSVLLGSSVFVNFVLVFAACLGFFLIYRKKSIILPQGSNAFEMETNLRCFSYRELVEATNGFKEELGRGAFGIVYKGKIGTTTRSFVAVKKLGKVVENGDKEFKTEVEVIAKTHQKNLVNLLGFCYEGEHRLLVYEYVSNGTLASFLFADKKPSWRHRTHIALGIARGLSYLHEDCNTQIIHCDIKPQNVLLDEFYEPRISDFGLSKLLRIDQSQTNTAIRGTKGYVAPEWFRNTPITIKVDVYSFGVLLLEIISCRRSVEHLETGDDQEKAILTDWAWDCFQQGRLNEFVDNDVEALSERRKLEIFVKIGIWCVHEDPYMRPTMRKVIQMLEGVTQVTEPPCPSPFSISR